MSKPQLQETPAGSPISDLELDASIKNQILLNQVDPAIITALDQALVNDKIERMETALMELPQVEIPVTERFVNGMYTREIVIPAGTLLTGRVHKEPYVDLMLEGDIVVATPAGVRRLIGFNHADGLAGRKRAGYAITDTRWITVHRTDQVRPGDMENVLTCWSIGDYRLHRRQLEQLATL